MPADILLLRTSDPSGTCFVRTDQLDGETDWKLRVAVERTQALGRDELLLEVEGEVEADPPGKDIHSFVGTLNLSSLPLPASTVAPATGEEDPEDDLIATSPSAALPSSSSPSSSAAPVEPLTAENMLWANTVLAAGQAVGVVVYTGRETRAVMNTSQPGTKVGLLDEEINRLAKVRLASFFPSLPSILFPPPLHCLSKLYPRRKVELTSNARLPLDWFDP